MNKKKVLKKFFIYSLIATLISILLSTIYIYSPSLTNSIDNRLRDYLFTTRGEIPNTNSIIIIDIDEKSLRNLGQWPWSRNKISKILYNLTQNNIGLIVFDMVFAEEDKSSPHKVFENLNIKAEKQIPNYENEFAKAIANTPTILGYMFELNQNSYINKTSPNIPAIFIERNKPENFNTLIEAKGTILNIPILQDSAYSSGFFNSVPDESGVIRSVPLIISYDNIIYPSLSLEVLRLITNTQKVFINYDQQGVKDISLNNLTIPTDRHGRILVNYRGKEKNFKYYSAIDIFENKVDKKELEGKIALIGTSAAGLLDLRSTPFESVFPGVEIHANAIDNAIKGDFIHKPSWIDGINILIIFALSFLIVLLITFTPIWLTPIIVLLTFSSVLISSYILLFDYGLVFNLFFPLLTIIIASIITILFDYFYEIKKEEAIKRKFASKVSKEVMNNLLKNIDSNEFQAMQKEVTIFFSDIRNFTNISEKMQNAKELISYINKYMEPMSNIITKYEGTIDKYIGDAIMAYWNAPADVKNHADKAVLASLEQISQLKTLNTQLKKENKPPIDIGIGINTGEAIVGEMGSIKRSDYTVIGDAINLGSRLESLCKYYGSKLNISNYTKERLEGEYIFRFLDLVKVKGKNKPVEIWQVIDKGKPSKELKNELEQYHQAIKLYKDSKFDESLKILEQLNNEKIYDIYIQRCKEFIKTRPANFDGVYKHVSK